MARAGSGVDGSGRIRGAATKAVVAALAKGDFHRVLISVASSQAWTAGTEVLIGSSIGPGAGEEKLYPYVRYRVGIGNATASVPIIVAVVHYRGGDGVPTLDAEQTLEDYRVGGRLYHWEIASLPGDHSHKWFDFKFRNVKLPAQEYLRFYVCPLVTDNTYMYAGHCDYSEVIL